MFLQEWGSQGMVKMAFEEEVLGGFALQVHVPSDSVPTRCRKERS